MADGVKIVTIGGGSSYTPELMEGFIKRYDKLPIREIWLVDIEDGKEKLDIVSAMAQRMWDASPYDVTVHTTLDRREALPGADFVTTQFRVGLLYARIKDWLINFTNPSGMVTEAAIKRFGWKKTIGLCNVPVGAMMDEPKLIG